MFNTVFLMRMMANTRGLHTALFATQRKLLGLQMTAQQTNAQFRQLGVTVGFFGGVVLASSIRQYAKFNKELTDSFALLQRFGDQNTFAGMEQAALSAARKTMFGADQIASGFRYLFSAGMDAEQSIAAIEAVSKFAQAGLFDLNRAVDLSTDALTALDWASKDPQTNLRNLTEIMDTLTHANTIANATVQQFSEALTKEAAAAARAYKIPLDEVIATLGVYADQGLKGALGGRMFSRFLRMVTASAVRNEEVFHRLGITIFDANGNMRSMVDIVRDLTSALNQFAPEQRSRVLEMLGFMARTQQTVLPLLGMADELYDKLQKMGGKDGAVNRIVDIQNTSWINQLSLASKELKEASIALGEAVSPSVIWFVKQLSAGMAGMKDFVLQQGDSKTRHNRNVPLPRGLGFLQRWILNLTNPFGSGKAGEEHITFADSMLNEIAKAYVENLRLQAQKITERATTNLDATLDFESMIPGGYAGTLQAQRKKMYQGLFPEDAKSVRRNVMRELQMLMTEAGKELADSVRNAAIDQAMRNNNPIRAMSLMAQEYMRLQQASVGLEFDDLVANMRKRFDLSMQLRGLLQDYSGGSVLAPALMPGTREFQEARYSRNGGAQSEMSALTEVMRLNKDATTQLKDTLGQMLIDWTRGGQIQPGAIPQAGF